MLDDSDPQTPESAAGTISRRHAIGWLGIALGGMRVREPFTVGAAATAPTGNWRQPNLVTFLDAAALRRAIRAAPEENPGQAGLYSLHLSDDTGYPVIGIRRTVVTRSEVHAAFSDVWYVLEGSATLVTGGALVDGVETGPGELRGRSIAGGEARRIQAGDFAVVPAGVPHWVSRIGRGELLYFVVKVPERK